MMEYVSSDSPSLKIVMSVVASVDDIALMIKLPSNIPFDFIEKPEKDRV